MKIMKNHTKIAHLCLLQLQFVTPPMYKTTNETSNNTSHIVCTVYMYTALQSQGMNKSLCHSHVSPQIIKHRVANMFPFIV